MLNSLANDTVIWDRKLIELKAQNGKWLLHFENETFATADFVIGANGGMSTARKYITETNIENTGTFIIQGEIFKPEIECANFYQLCNNNILMTSFKGISLVANPNNNGALTYNVIFRSPEEWVGENGLNFQDTGSIIMFLSNLLADWNEIYKKLLRSTSSLIGLPTRKFPLSKTWKNDRSLPITLVRDAAHIMPPFAGEGVNIGLLDTIILSDNLTNGKVETIQEAINDYEQQMIVYATEAQLETSKNEIQILRPDFSFHNFMKA